MHCQPDAASYWLSFDFSRRLPPFYSVGKLRPPFSISLYFRDGRCAALPKYSFPILFPSTAWEPCEPSWLAPRARMRPETRKHGQGYRP